ARRSLAAFLRDLGWNALTPVATLLDSKTGDQRLPLCARTGRGARLGCGRDVASRGVRHEQGVGSAADTEWWGTSATGRRRHGDVVGELATDAHREVTWFELNQPHVEPSAPRW